MGSGFRCGPHLKWVISRSSSLLTDSSIGQRGGERCNLKIVGYFREEPSSMVATMNTLRPIVFKTKSLRSPYMCHVFGGKEQEMRSGEFDQRVGTDAPPPIIRVESPDMFKSATLIFTWSWIPRK